MDILRSDNIKSIPRFEQSQAALNDQLALLRAAANCLGLYDAADYLGNVLTPKP